MSEIYLLMRPLVSSDISKICHFYAILQAIFGFYVAAHFSYKSTEKCFVEWY